MRLSRQFVLAAILLALSASAFAGPFGFIFFWRHSAPRIPTHEMQPQEKSEIADLLSATAEQKCENWAWAAGLQTILKSQGIDVPQKFWIMKADGGEVCKDELGSLQRIAKVIEGEYVLPDGRKVRLQANTVNGAPTQMDSLILAPREKRPLLFFWKGHAYVYRGMIYNQMIAATGDREFEVRQVELLDPFFETAEKQTAVFDREKDDPATINGMMDVTATFIHGPDWLHPEKELEHPTEIYFPR